MKTLIALALSVTLSIATASCSSKDSASDAAAASEAAANEAASRAGDQAAVDAAQAAADAAVAAADAAAAGATTDSSPSRKTDGSGCTVPNQKESETFGLILNLNSLLCAKVVKVCALEVRDALEVTCIEYRGGSATKTYIVDVKTATAFEQ